MKFVDTLLLELRAKGTAVIRAVAFEIVIEELLPCIILPQRHFKGILSQLDT